MEQSSDINQRKNKIIGIFAILSMIVLIVIYIPQFLSNNEQTGEYEDISVSTAYAMRNDTATYPDLIILDVRTQSEYDTEHLNNSILIPLDELENRLGELEYYNNTEIIVHCQSGSRSRSASAILGSNGFLKIYNMLGGINAWIDAGYPTTLSYFISPFSSALVYSS